MGDGGVINMKQTKKKHLLVLLGAGLFILSGTVAAGTATIVGSKHDFSSGGGGANATTVGDGTTDTCVFCHTPHAAAGGQVPLWNKALPTATTFNPYSSSTLDAASIASADIVGGPSLACLSCHDGTGAVDNVINAAGSGAGTGGSAGYTFSSAGTVIDGTNSITDTRVSVIGADLSDDHPISVQYAGGTYGTVGAGGDPDFTVPKDNGGAGADKRWWVDTEAVANNTREKTDMILYTRNIVAAGTYEPFVECATCHDPHNGFGQATDPTSQMFLRIANDSSAVCTACHTK
jgi:hypothetical protein